MVLMIIGIIVLCMGLFGCTGLPMRHKPTAVAFYISANILIFLEIGLGIYWAIMWSNYQKYLSPDFQTAFDNFKAEPQPWQKLHESVRINLIVTCGRSLNNSWSLFLKLPCCGINGPNDFQSNYSIIPAECCHYSQKLGNSLPRTPSFCPMSNAVKEGCEPMLLDVLKNDAYLFIFTAVICGVLKWLILLMAFVLPFEDSPPSEFKVSGAGSAYYFTDRNNR